jgi:putative pyruvate formate lyase activating enzyme
MSFSYEKCGLCGRNCGIDRNKTIGFCKMTSELFVSRAALHMWEEPIISGTNGSGTVFFSGCSLLCSYCQNREISRGVSGIGISVDRLSEIMLELQSKGAHNVNLVTPTHFAPSIKQAVKKARREGLAIPIVYNTSSYDSVEALRHLFGTVDIYLADFKYYFKQTAQKLSSAENYPEVAKKAIEEMVRQTGEPVIGEDGLLKKGTVVRILLLPGHVGEAKLIVNYLQKNYKNKIFVSLMSQYTPQSGMEKPLDRRVARSEYRELVDYAIKLGVDMAFIQDYESADESFIPPFDNTGVKQ